MEELHEFLGILVLVAGLGAIVCGGIIYRFRWLKVYLGNRRNLFLKGHYYLASAGILFLIGHYLTTNKQNVFLITGAALTLAVYIAGYSLRFSKRLMRKIINAKIIALLMLAILLPIGHSLVEEHEHGKESINYESHYDD